MKPSRVVVPSSAVLLAVLALLAGGCGGSDEPSSAPDGDEAVAATGEPGPTETGEVTVALPFPDVTMFALFVVASDLGYYEDEGLKVKIITADDVNAAVASGSADVGVQNTGGAIEAIRNGLPITVLGGRGCRETFSFAVQPDVKTVQDLDGTEVAMAGTPGDPDEFARKRVLKEEGWDLDSVDAKVVYPGTDSSTWREFFLADRIAMMPFFGDDRPALEKYGANIVVDTIRTWPSDVQVVNAKWLEENPNTAVRFLRATLKSAEFILAPNVGEAPENKEKVLEIYEANDFDISDLRSLPPDSPWGLDGQILCPNLPFDEAAWNTTIEVQHLDPLDFTVDLSYLERAQQLVGVDNAPPTEVQFP